MENTVSLEHLHAIRSKMEEIAAQYNHIVDLNGKLWKDKPMLPLYSPSSALRDLPPPWEGHGLGIFFALWLLFLDVWGGGLLGGLIFGLCTWQRIKKEPGSWKRKAFMAFSLMTAPIIVMVALMKLMEGGGTWTMVAVLAFAAWFLGGLLMVPAKVKANAQIREENQVRAEKNEQMKPYNRNLQQKISCEKSALADLQGQLADLIDYYGYPPDYATFHAVDYFISCVRNHRAETYSRLIDLYMEELHRQKMAEESRRQTDLLRQQMENQERIQGQLAYANMLQFNQLLAQDETNQRLAQIQGDLNTMGYSR